MTTLRKNFTFNIEAEAFYKADAPQGQQRRIGGWVSTDGLDQQGEVLVQEGLDFRPFLNKGFFNDNHLKQTGKAVGYPEIAELRDRPDGLGKGWYVEGYLLEGHGPADEIWSLAQSLERSGAPRRLGYSVEGQILERKAGNTKIVKKALVNEVAITRCPVNTETEMVMLAKSLSAGAPGSAGGTPGDGAPLRTESLEAQPAPRPEGDDEDEDTLKKKKKSMKKSEAVAFLMSRHPSVSRHFATQIVEYALRQESAA